MNNLRIYLAIPFLVLTLAVGAQGRDDKKVEVTKEKLVGTWECDEGRVAQGHHRRVYQGRQAQDNREERQGNRNAPGFLCHRRR